MSDPVIELVSATRATVGNVEVRRLLPHRAHRTVGAWCFADHFGPAPVTSAHGIDIGPHPHCGLQTVTWLVSGEVLHRDSLGSEQLIRPGQLNLMSAGHGVSHSEEATGTFAGELHGTQLWVAQPERTRHDPPTFEHHTGLPHLELGTAVATVMVGTLGGVSSPARTDTDLVGAELALRAGRATVPLQPHHEHAVVTLDGQLTSGGVAFGVGTLAYLGAGNDELVLHAERASRVLLLGGEPFAEPLFMWWNFVGRTRDEMDRARTEWEQQDGRFGSVDSRLKRITAPVPLWSR